MYNKRKLLYFQILLSFSSSIFQIHKKTYYIYFDMFKADLQMPAASILAVYLRFSKHVSAISLFTILSS